MKFHVGQDVYIKWHPTSHARLDREFMCSFGVITNGPYPPYYRFYHKLSGDKFSCRQTTWKVETASGEAIVAQSLLKPFHEPGREMCMDDCLELTE